jgi:hypothetical protein
VKLRDGNIAFVPAVVHGCGIAVRYGDHSDKILAAYPHSTPAEAFKASKDIFRDSALAWHTWTWVKLQSNIGKGNETTRADELHRLILATAPSAKRLKRKKL